jgi:hypothetical protein
MLFPIPLGWHNSKQVWVEQWPLTNEKLTHLKVLVKEQFDKDHLEYSTSAWNTPVFVIQKRAAGCWRLLQDLQEINRTMKKMGTTQPVTPLINFVPAGYAIRILDLKNCFFNIHLHPKDRERFAFSVPNNNNATHCAWYQWTVLPQGMKNSPTLCQIYVSPASQPFFRPPASLYNSLYEWHFT